MFKGKLEILQELKGIDKDLYKTEWLEPKHGCMFARYGKNGEITFWKETSRKKWSCFSKIQNQGEIYDLKFGPELLGFVFALTSSDGSIKFYQNGSNNEKSWKIIEELKLEGCQKISWTIKEERFPSLAVSCPEKNLVSIWYFNTLLKNWEERIQISCKSEIIDIKWSPYTKDINQLLIVMKGGIIKIANLQNDDEQDVKLKKDIKRSKWSDSGDRIILYSDNEKYILDYSKNEWKLFK